MIELSFSDYPRLRRRDAAFFVYTREQQADGLVDSGPCVAIGSGDEAYAAVRDKVLENPDIRDYSIVPMDRRTYAELRRNDGDRNMISAALASAAMHDITR